MTSLRLVQLAYPGGRPADASDPTATYDAMATPAGLAEVARYADAIGVARPFVIPAGAPLDRPTGLVRDAHAAGLDVHVWTIRAENAFLPASLRRGGDPAGLGDVAAEVRALAAAGVDGIFTDQPDLVLAALGR